MLPLIRGYITCVEAVNYRVGRIAMYGIFLMIGVLLWSSIAKTFFLPSLWTLEIAQFLMVGYYMLGGAYSIQLGSNVRMDLLYANWSAKKKAWVDSITILFLIYFLCVLLWGGIDSTQYAIQYGERSYSSWRPYMWPIKIVMCLGLVLMLLQSSCEFIKDVALIRGVKL